MIQNILLLNLLYLNLLGTYCYRFKISSPIQLRSKGSLKMKSSLTYYKRDSTHDFYDSLYYFYFETVAKNHRQYATMHDLRAELMIFSQNYTVLFYLQHHHKKLQYVNQRKHSALHWSDGRKL